MSVERILITAAIFSVGLIALGAYLWNWAKYVR